MARPPCDRVHDRRWRGAGRSGRQAGCRGPACERTPDGALGNRKGAAARGGGRWRALWRRSRRWTPRLRSGLWCTRRLRSGLWCTRRLRSGLWQLLFPRSHLRTFPRIAGGALRFRDLGILAARVQTHGTQAHADSGRSVPHPRGGQGGDQPRRQAGGVRAEAGRPGEEQELHAAHDRRRRERAGAAADRGRSQRHSAGLLARRQDARLSVRPREGHRAVPAAHGRRRAAADHRPRGPRARLRFLARRQADRVRVSAAQRTREARPRRQERRTRTAAELQAHHAAVPQARRRGLLERPPHAYLDLRRQRPAAQAAHPRRVRRRRAALQPRRQAGLVRLEPHRRPGPLPRPERHLHGARGRRAGPRAGAGRYTDARRPGNAYRQSCA